LREAVIASINHENKGQVRESIFSAWLLDFETTINLLTYSPCQGDDNHHTPRIKPEGGRIIYCGKSSCISRRFCLIN